MESREISDDQITASSHYTGSGGLQAWKGRLNNDGNWAPSARTQMGHWIQVDLRRLTVITGIITQGSALEHDQWVTYLQIQHGHTENTLIFISENGKPKVSSKLTTYPWKNTFVRCFITQTFYRVLIF